MKTTKIISLNKKVKKDSTLDIPIYPLIHSFKCRSARIPGKENLNLFHYRSLFIAIPRIFYLLFLFFNDTSTGD